MKDVSNVIFRSSLYVRVPAIKVNYFLYDRQFLVYICFMCLYFYRANKPLRSFCTQKKVVDPSVKIREYRVLYKQSGDIRMKRYIVFIVVTAFLLAACSVFQVEQVEDIRVVVKKIKLKSIDRRRVALDVTISITNPNSFEVILSRAESDIYVNGRYLAQAISPRSVVIDKQAKDTIEIEINYRDVINVLENYNPKDTITCKADSILYFQLPRTFEKRKTYRKKMVIERELPSFNEMVKKEFNITL